MQRLRNGEIVVSPASEHDPRAIPGGLIHHWIGAVFIPDASIKDVLSTVEDYDRYGSFYPGVVASELIRRDGPVDRFWTVEKHKALFSRFALDAVFVSTYHDNPGSSRAYSTSETVRLQQIDHYGDPDQHELGPYAPSAYLWCLNTISRYEERDGGVYLELEAIGLSRGIPDGLHWLVDPFVRHAAAEAMTVALRQTRQAVLDNKYPAPAALTSGAAGFGDR